MVTISYEIVSREYNNNWNTDVIAFKIKLTNNPATIPTNDTFKNTVYITEDDEDLTFQDN